MVFEVVVGNRLVFLNKIFKEHLDVKFMGIRVSVLLILEVRHHIASVFKVSTWVKFILINLLFLLAFRHRLEFFLLLLLPGLFFCLHSSLECSFALALPRLLALRILMFVVFLSLLGLGVGLLVVL